MDSGSAGGAALLSEPLLPGAALVLGRGKSYRLGRAPELLCVSLCVFGCVCEVGSQSLLFPPPPPVISLANVCKVTEPGRFVRSLLSSRACWTLILSGFRFV